MSFQLRRRIYTTHTRTAPLSRVRVCVYVRNLALLVFVFLTPCTCTVRFFINAKVKYYGRGEATSKSSDFRLSHFITLQEKQSISRRQGDFCRNYIPHQHPPPFAHTHTLARTRMNYIFRTQFSKGTVFKCKLEINRKRRCKKNTFLPHMLQKKITRKK